MGVFSVQFSTNVDGRVRKYPHDLRGQEHSVSGVDRGAVEALRGGQTRDKQQIKVTAKVARELADQIADGARVSAYEKPVHYAVIAAAKGQDVKVTDATGHWRELVVTPAGARAFFEGVKGVQIA